MRQNSSNFNKGQTHKGESSIADLVAEIAVGMTHFAEGLTIAVQASMSSSSNNFQKNGGIIKELKDA